VIAETDEAEARATKRTATFMIVNREWAVEGWDMGAEGVAFVCRRDENLVVAPTAFLYQRRPVHNIVRVSSAANSINCRLQCVHRRPLNDQYEADDKAARGLGAALEAAPQLLLRATSDGARNCVVGLLP
jgi:hypothetical protein